VTNSPSNIDIGEQSCAEQPSLNLEDFAYQLPPDLIAQNPIAERDQSRLLCYSRNTQEITHYNFFYDLGSILQPGDILIVNNSRVLPVKLIGKRENGSQVELLLIRQDLSSPDLWQAMVFPIKKIRGNEIIRVDGKNTVHEILIEKIVVAQDGQRRLLVRLLSGRADIYNLLQDAGLTPLPPYIVNRRKADTGQCSSSINQSQIDLERYQTIFAKDNGSIAAPTAGLHFSSALLAFLKQKGVTLCEITLHVGPGTFKPISNSIKEHVIEAESFSISASVAQTLNQAKKNKQRIIAVGTTTCRALESAIVDGKLIPQHNAQTSLFIKPGFKFRLVDGLVTNFHLSKSSLLLLVAAIIGKDELMKTYAVAIEQRYRFYSYGDAMIII